jgi:hypothetical protein
MSIDIWAWPLRAKSNASMWLVQMLTQRPKP